MYELVMPAMNHFGAGCVAKVGELAQELNVSKALIVTDHNLVTLNIIAPLLESLNGHSLSYVIYDEVKPNPTKANVLSGVDVYHKEKCDFIIGVGGGSPNDCAKAIGIMVSNGGHLEDYVGFNQSKQASPFLFMVNTTSGTASEISRAFLISDEEKQEKLIFKDIHALPYASFNDPNLMINLPGMITASTGMDALTHAMESFVSTGKYTLTQTMSLSAIDVILNTLEKVMEEPHNIELREQMIYAQTLAGMSFCNSGLGLVHAMAHQLGGVYNLPHGLCNAILLPYVMTYNQQVCATDYAFISKKVFPYETKEMTEMDASSYLIKKVKDMSHSIGTDKRLTELGVKQGDVSLLASKTLLDGNLPRNPIQPTQSEIEQLFIAAL